jgi:hypothetical protein
MVFTQLQGERSDSMGQVYNGGCCSLCGKCRSARSHRVQNNEGLIAQICSRRTCAGIKDLLRKRLGNNSNASSLVIEVHHYHHASRPNEDRLERTHIYSSELHAESLPNDHTVLPVCSAGRLSTVREEPPPVEAFTKPSENVVRQRLYKGAVHKMVV